MIKIYIFLWKQRRFLKKTSIYPYNTEIFHDCNIMQCYCNKKIVVVVAFGRTTKIIDNLGNWLCLTNLLFPNDTFEIIIIIIFNIWQ